MFCFVSFGIGVGRGGMELRLPASSIVHYSHSQRSKSRSSRRGNWQPDFGGVRKWGFGGLGCLAMARASDDDEMMMIELEKRKYNLLTAIQDTHRGLLTTPDQRSSIEEAIVGVECYGDAGGSSSSSSSSSAIELDELDGTWRLQYTSAPDVLILFQSASTLPFFQVGQIFQKFECQGQKHGGYVRNVVRWSITNLFEEQEGATLLVSAKFSVVSSRNIYLQFEEIAVQNINISEELQAVIAPAMLPRTFLSLQILQSIRSFKAQVPVRNSGSGKQSVGGLYYLSYLDNNMLLGRAVGGGGVFIFTRAQPIL